MSQVRAVQEAATADFAAFLQLAATVGTRRGTLVGLRWSGVDLNRKTITFTHSIADSVDGPVEKGTKADRPYTVALGSSPVAVLATITVEPRNGRWRWACRSTVTPSCSQMTVGPATGAWLGRRTAGSVMPSGSA